LFLSCSVTTPLLGTHFHVEEIMMSRVHVVLLTTLTLSGIIAGTWLYLSPRVAASTSETQTRDHAVNSHAQRMIDRGRNTFRYDTFGDQDFWGDTLQLHKAIEGQALGGVGPGVDPATALSVGLKVDQDALPPSLIRALRLGKVNLKDPVVTVALLKLNAVLGVTGFFNQSGHLRSLGIQCALCHSTVDNALAPGIGRRLNGWANRDLNVGAIVNLSPDLSSVAKLLTWIRQASAQCLQAAARENLTPNSSWMERHSMAASQQRR
jgi:hypothetical protein